MYSMDDKNKFSIWLKSEMDKRDWNQSELARKADVTRSAVNGVLTGARNPGNDLCEAIAKAFNMPPEDVFRFAGLLPPKQKKDKLTEEAEYLLSQMPEDKREQAIRFIRFLSQEGNHENTAANSMGGAK